MSVTYQWGESGDTAVELTPTGGILGVYIEDPADITFDLDAGSGTWEQRRRWYWWLASQAEQPKNSFLDDEALGIFIEVYKDAAQDWLAEVTA